MMIAPPGLETIEEIGSYRDAIVACVEHDERLQLRFSEFVPSRLTEAKFWSVYFYKVEFLIQFGANVEHSSPGQCCDAAGHEGKCEGEGEERELEAIPAGPTLGSEEKSSSKEAVQPAGPSPPLTEAGEGELTAEGDDDFTLAVHREVMVYAQIAPMRSSGYYANEWDVHKWDWSGRMRIVAHGYRYR